MNIGNLMHQAPEGKASVRTITQPQEEETIDVTYIVKEKPSVKIVRAFLKATLASLKSEEEVLFDER